jgi:tetratricopeptide (TPR) repeat protein
MKTTENNQRVQAYFGGELSAEEKNDFENNLKSDTALQKEFELHTQISDAVIDPTLHTFKKKIDQIHNEIRAEQKFLKPNHYRRISLIAASIIILMTIGSLFLFNSYNQPSTDEVFSAYFEPYEMSLTTRSHDVNIPTQLDKATELYNNLEYFEAKLLLKEFLILNSTDASASLMLGIANMQLDEVEEAMVNFNVIIKSENPFYTQQASWYLALCYVKKDDLIGAKHTLEAIASDTGYYKEDAKNLLDEIK